MPIKTLAHHELMAWVKFILFLKGPLIRSKYSKLGLNHPPMRRLLGIDSHFG
jgi:hypothetical protein